METISKAVCESNRRESTILEMRSGILQHHVVRHGRADGADNALADAGDNRLLGGPADQLLQVGPHGHAGLDLQLHAVLRHAVERIPAQVPRGTVDDLGIDAGLHGFQHVAAGQVDGGCQLEVEFELGLPRGDQRTDHQRHVAARQVVRLKALRGHPVAIADAGLHGHDLAANDHPGTDFAKGHAHQVQNADPRPRGHRLDPEAEVVGEDRQNNQAEQKDQDRNDDDMPGGPARIGNCGC